MPKSLQKQKADLKLLRQKIDKLDEAIIKKLAIRQKLSKKIGLLKNQTGQSIRDFSREANQQKRYQQFASTLQLDKTFISRLFTLIIAYSRKVQKS